MDPTQSAPPSPRSSGHVWRFADSEFDELRHELRVRGGVAEIEPKPLEVLRQLLLHAGEVVTKDELLESVWPGLTVVDSSLATAISKLRKVVGDDSVIVTVPRIGYRLGVPVHRTTGPAPEWSELHLQPGESVPGRVQWRLVRRLDTSPSSDVWLGENSKTRDARVFKFAADQARLGNLKREVTLARLLRQSFGERPEFVRILEWNFAAPPYFVESEYAGPSLGEWAERQGGLGAIPLDVRLRLVADVARAVALAHQIEVLHKDLKPANILVADAAGGEPQIKVADFGSAALLAPARLDALGITNLGFTHDRAEPGTLTGTVLYVAPEVLAGQSPSPLSDVYALGVLLYQMAVGDFRKPLAPGWEADIPDPLLREDIAGAACGDPTRRVASAAELADRIVTLEQRRVAGARARAEAIDRAMRSRRRWRAATVAAVLLALAAAAIAYRLTSSPAQRVRTIAVLPFHDAGSDGSINFLRLALADEVSTILSGVPGLAVRPASSTRRYDQPNVDIREAASALAAGTIVTGQFVQAADQLQITLEAVDVESNRVLWRDTIDAPARSLIAAQVQIALRVRRGLVPAFGAAPPGGAAWQPTSEEAYRGYVHSLALGFDSPINARGIELLERAVALDPKYPPAWLALGRRYYVEARYTSGNSALIPRYEDAMRRALALDPDYVPAAAGLVVSRVEAGDLEGAHRTADGITRRRPDSVDAHFALSYVLRFAGLLPEAARHCETAFLLDPRTQTSGLRSCAIVFLHLGDYPRAMNYLQLDAGSTFAKAFTVHMLVQQGKTPEAVQIGPARVPQWGSYDMLLACAAQRPAAEIRAMAAGVQPSDDPEANYLAAAHLSYCGEVDASIELLRRAIAGNYCSYPAMDSDPLFATVRKASAFGAIRAAGAGCQRAFLAARRRPR